MSTIQTTLRPGQFAWADLAATDTQLAQSFYSTVFGWQMESSDMGDGRKYITFKLQDMPVCGLLPMTEEQKAMGGSSFWTSYLQIADVDRLAMVARMRGAALLVDPFDMGGHGRVSILQDPGGAIFAIRSGGRPGTPMPFGPGSICWYELHAVDPAKSSLFYSRLLGWEEQKMDFGVHDYYVLNLESEGISGITGLSPDAIEKGDLPQWLFYVAVTDCDATVATAQGLGAQVLLPSTDIPDVGRCAVMRDPVGGVVGVLARP